MAHALDPLFRRPELADRFRYERLRPRRLRQFISDLARREEYCSEECCIETMQNVLQEYNTAYQQWLRDNRSAQIDGRPIRFHTFPGLDLWKRYYRRRQQFR